MAQSPWRAWTSSWTAGEAIKSSQPAREGGVGLALTEAEADFGELRGGVVEDTGVVPGLRGEEDDLALVGHEVEVAAVGIHVHAAQVDAAGRTEDAAGAVAETLEELLRGGAQQGNAPRQHARIAAVGALERGAHGGIGRIERGEPLTAPEIPVPHRRGSLPSC